ncbi:hypothetical protein CsSME_00041051 [Camellia sinensis var. sinensis]
MGFDNECILNIQCLAGEYFCPVCRLLVYPDEALQSKCTHLYCKPCLTYIVGTTQACPYDGYLVTEADSKFIVSISGADANGRVLYLSVLPTALVVPLETPQLYATGVESKSCIVKCRNMRRFVLVCNLKHHR